MCGKYNCLSNLWKTAHIPPCSSSFNLQCFCSVLKPSGAENISSVDVKTQTFQNNLGWLLQARARPRVSGNICSPLLPLQQKSGLCLTTHHPVPGAVCVTISLSLSVFPLWEPSPAACVAWAQPFPVPSPGSHYVIPALPPMVGLFSLLSQLSAQSQG